jgi:hypothetical protein
MIIRTQMSYYVCLCSLMSVILESENLSTFKIVAELTIRLYSTYS